MRVLNKKQIKTIAKLRFHGIAPKDYSQFGVDLPQSTVRRYAWEIERERTKYRDELLGKVRKYAAIGLTQSRIRLQLERDSAANPAERMLISRQTVARMMKDIRAADELAGKTDKETDND